MSRTNETRQIKWHEKCKCICRLNGIIYILFINKDGIKINVDVIVKN